MPFLNIVSIATSFADNFYCEIVIIFTVVYLHIATVDWFIIFLM